MEKEYRDLQSSSIENGIIFYGLECCEPNYIFMGNTVRENYVIHYIRKGCGTFSSAGSPLVKLKQGDCFILPKGVPCFYQADENDPWEYSWIGLSGIRTGEIFAASSISEKNYLRQIQDTEFKNSLSRLYESLHLTHNTKNSLLTESLLYKMFHDLLDEFPAEITRKTNSQTQFRLAVEYMRDNYDTGCSILDVCRGLSVSRSYLYSLFKKFAGSSPQKFLTEIRMEEAEHLLKDTDRSIQNIADSIGYGDSFTFSKAFRKSRGCSPTDFRRMRN